MMQHFWFNENGASFTISTESSETSLEWDKWDCWTEYYDWFAHRVVPAEREIFSYLLQEAYYDTPVQGLDFELVNIYYNHGKNKDA